MPQDNNSQKENFNTGKVLIEWPYPEFIKYERGKKWYIKLFIISGLFLIYSIITKNFLLSIIIVMFILIIMLRDKKEPRKINFAITDVGIMIGDRFYPFREFNNFSIIYEPPQVKVLYLVFKSKITPRFSVSLEDQDPGKVRNIIQNHLNEDLDRNGESLSDALGRWLKI